MTFLVYLFPLAGRLLGRQWTPKKWSVDQIFLDQHTINWWRKVKVSQPTSKEIYSYVNVHKHICIHLNYWTSSHIFHKLLSLWPAEAYGENCWDLILLMYYRPPKGSPSAVRIVGESTIDINPERHYRSHHTWLKTLCSLSLSGRIG